MRVCLPSIQPGKVYLFGEHRFGGIGFMGAMLAYQGILRNGGDEMGLIC